MVKDLNDPTNRDMIPAMLTPGEFVLNKEATAMYGPLIEKMNNQGLQQRKAENQMVKANIGKKISKLHGEGYQAPGQAYAIAKSMGYNTGGLVSFLKEKEGYDDKAYQDSAGVWTIGYGRTTNPDGSPVQPGQTTDRKEEDKWLDARASSELAAINQYAEKYGYDWSDGQKNALASFRYNGGQGMLDMLTDGGTRDNDTIQQKFGLYNKVTNPNTGKKEFVQGLQNRRDAELELWNGTTPKETQPAPPSGASQQTTQAAQVPPPEEAPPAPAGGEVSMFPDLSSGINSALGQAMAGGQALPVVPTHQLQQVNPEYIPSVTEQSNPRRKNPGLFHSPPGFNGGGQVQYLRNGGRANITEEERERRRLARLAGANNTSQGRNVPRQAPIVAPTAPQQPMQSSAGRNVGRAGVSKSDPFVQQYPTNADVGAVPRPESPPSLNNVPPVPGSDEAILQGSSQQVEQRETAPEDWRSLVDPQDLAAAVPPSSGSGAIDSGIIGPDSAPSQEYVDAQIQGGFTSPEQVAAAQADLGPVPPGFEAPPPATGDAAKFDEAGREGKPAIDQTIADMTPDQKDNAAKTIAESNLSKIQEPPNEAVEAAGADGVAAAGEARMKQNPRAGNQIKRQIKETFGDLIDGKELARMALLWVGARATGASPGQALAFAGQQYLGRMDAKANYINQLTTSGKYQPSSIQEYKKTGDISVLQPVGASYTQTGKFSKRYTKDGQAIDVQEVKDAAGNVHFQAANGQLISGFATNATSPEERRAEVKKQADHLRPQLTALREQLDAFEIDGQKSSKTDLIPEVAAGKVAEFFVNEGVDPQEASSIMEAAYHDMVNDRRQDKSRARDIVPYIRQNILRNRLGNHTQAFVVKPGKDGEPPQYVDPAKLQGLNQAAASWLSGLGAKGNTKELSNQFYTAALEDWNGLSAEDKKLYERKARKDENGFFVYTSQWLTNKIGG